ncbi:MAG: polysaccharide biosynthesis/export family protein [Opitutales bacterium]
MQYLPKFSLKSAAFLFPIAAFLGFTGCSTIEDSPFPSYHERSTAFSSDFRPPVDKDQAFYLYPGDEIQVKFYYDPELNETLRIRPDGVINLNLIEPKIAVGKTPEELADELTQAFTEVIDNPRLTVIVRDISRRVIYIDGEVGDPQALQTRSMRVNVFHAIALAGGTRRSADLSKVSVIRNTSEGVEGVVLDLTQEDRWDQGALNLFPGDIVYVPKRDIAYAGDFVDFYINNLIPDFIRFSAGYNLNNTTIGVRDDEEDQQADPNQEP